MRRITIFSLLIAALAASACLAWMPYFNNLNGGEDEPKIDPESAAWHRQRIAKLEQHLANTHSGSPPSTPTTADEYLKHFESDEIRYRLYIERLPFAEYQKVTQHFLDKFPVVSLQDRLRYEDDAHVMREHAAKHQYDLGAVAAVLHDDWNTHRYPGDGQPVKKWSRPLPRQEAIRRGRHQRALEILHRDRLEAFANQDSFGWERIPQIDIQDLYVSPTQLVKAPQPLPKVNKSSSNRVQRELFDNEKEWVKEVENHYPKYLHLSMYHQFAEDWAYSPSFRQARGHVPHFVTSSVGWDFDVYRDPSPPVWHVQSLELVSLLKHGSPKVYESDALPNMSELEKAKTRELDEFEDRSLKQLYSGEFLVSSENASEMRVLGAVRAGKTCIECHAVKPGQLLGAFSYRIAKVEPKDLGKP